MKFDLYCPSFILGMPPMKYYVLFSSHKLGIYESGHECHLQVNGYMGNLHCSYPTLAEAEENLKLYNDNVKNRESASTSRVLGTNEIPSKPYDKSHASVSVKLDVVEASSQYIELEHSFECNLKLD